jgi:putative redox protein
MSVKLKAVLLDRHKTEVEHLPSGTKFKTDAPADHAGEGSYISPTDMVAGALATCVITTISIVAAKNGWNVNGTYADAEKNMKSEPRRIGPVLVEVHMPISLSAEARLKLEEAGQRCPVHKSLLPECEAKISFFYDV